MWRITNERNRFNRTLLICSNSAYCSNGNRKEVVMSEVEKMYENAGVERELAYFECHRGRSSICCPIEEYEKDDGCMGCINSSAMKEVYEYPPFTEEKQLELIKWFMHSEHFSPVRFNVRWVVDDIASYINFLWQVLTEEEKQQVKEILR